MRVKVLLKGSKENVEVERECENVFMHHNFNAFILQAPHISGARSLDVYLKKPGDIWVPRENVLMIEFE